MSYDYDAIANRAVERKAPTREEALQVLTAEHADVPAIVAAGWKVRHHFCGTTVRMNYLVNAKSGACPEDCSYCSQSRVSTADIEKYRLMDADEIVKGADKAAALGASTCCIVISGRGPNQKEVDRVDSAVRDINALTLEDVRACLLPIINDKE